MTRRPHDTAVAVIGGGIAGAAACVALGRAGLETVWIAPDAEPGAHLVGESLAPAALPILERLGLSAIVDGAAHRRSNVSFAAWGSDLLVERNAAVHLEGPGRVLDRARFEADLRAVADGIAERRRSALVDAATEAGRWRLGLADGSALSAGFLVDASGRSGVVARRRAAMRRDDRLVAACAFLPHRDGNVEPTPATLIETVPDGWWYASLLPDGRLSVACFSDPDLLPRGLSRDRDRWSAMIGRTRHVGRWIADAGFSVETPPRLHSAGTRWADPAAGKVDGAGWAAIGDAAAAFDPLSSHGMTTALWSAARIAEVVAAWLAGDGGPLAGYARAVTDGVDRFRGQRTALYARERRFAGAPFWRRRVPRTAAFRGSRRAG